jgi:KDO2-lipid IV(A) lauroyltransferase
MATENIMCSLQLEPKAAGHIAKQSAARFGRMFMEVLSFPLLNKQNIQEAVTFSGLEHLIAALSKGRGVVLATSHSGNWELLGNALALQDMPIVGVAQKQTNAAMDKFINEYRTMFGMQVAYKSGVRDMVRLLGQGKIIGLLMDQDAGYDGVFVDFFGRPAATPTGPAALARLMDAPIVPCFITETSPGRHQVIVHPMLEVEKTPRRDDDVFNTTKALTKIVEEHVRKFPQEWFWLHNRWKHQPKNK